MLRQINWMSPTFQWISAKVGYGKLDNVALENTTGINFHLSYSIMMKEAIGTSLTISYDNYQYGKRKLDSQEFDAQMSFISVNLGFHFN